LGGQHLGGQHLGGQQIAPVPNFYNATGSLMRFEDKKYVTLI
jgi:hypothetical protein